MKRLLLFFFMICVLSYLSADESALERYLSDKKVAHNTQVRFFAYLYSAQYDAFEYSEAVQQAVSSEIIHYFFPNFSQEPCPAESIFTAQKILAPYYARLKVEAGRKEVYRPCWNTPVSAHVQQIANWIPWIPLVPEAPPPLAAQDAKGWEKQFAILLTIRKNLTPEQRQLALDWSGHGTQSFDLRGLLNAYLEKNPTDPRKAMLARATLMKGLHDGLIAEMRDKYYYCIPRPYMMDPSFQPLIPRLDTPSYPSGHGIKGGVFATILTAFFPEHGPYWKHLADQGSSSRLWAGVHFPEDIEQGTLLGEKVAQLELRLAGRLQAH